MKSQRITGTASNCLIVTRFGCLEDASGVEKGIIPLRLMAVGASPLRILGLRRLTRFTSPASGGGRRTPRVRRVGDRTGKTQAEVPANSPSPAGERGAHFRGMRSTNVTATSCSEPERDQPANDPADAGMAVPAIMPAG